MREFGACVLVGSELRGLNSTERSVSTMQLHSGIHPSTIRLLLLILTYVTFLILGAAIFSAIEAPDEANRIKALKEHRERFLLNNECVRGKHSVHS